MTDNTWEHSTACGRHDATPCTCKAQLRCCDCKQTFSAAVPPRYCPNCGSGVIVETNRDDQDGAC